MLFLPRLEAFLKAKIQATSRPGWCYFASSAHTRQSRPDQGLGFKAKGIQMKTQNVRSIPRRTFRWSASSSAHMRHTYSLSHTHILCLSSFSHTHTLCLSLSLTHTVSLTRIPSLSLNKVASSPARRYRDESGNGVQHELLTLGLHHPCTTGALLVSPVQKNDLRNSRDTCKKRQFDFQKSPSTRHAQTDYL